MMYCNIETKSQFLKENDKYGDNFTQDLTIKSLEEVFILISSLKLINIVIFTNGKKKI